MWFTSIFAFGRSASGRTRRPRAPAKPRRGLRLNLEQLENRMLPSSYSAATVSDLIADINAANAAGGTNTITLTAPTTSPYYTAGLVITGGKNADNLTIVGNGDTIDASHSGRMFDVANGGSLTLENMTLQNGLASGSGAMAEGGAIYNEGTLVLSTVTVQGNVAQGSNGYQTVKGPTAGNPAAGGAIWSSGSLTLENGTLVQNNQAIGGNGVPGLNGQFIFVAGSSGGTGSGGGLFVAGGTAYLTGVTVNNNRAVSGLSGAGFANPPCYGGGLYVDPATVILSGDTVNGNVVGVQNELGLGGGMYIASGKVTLCNDTVENNLAFGTDTGGISIDKAKVYIDSFTVAHTINNGFYNIIGTYILQNC